MRNKFVALLVVCMILTAALLGCTQTSAPTPTTAPPATPAPTETPTLTPTWFPSPYLQWPRATFTAADLADLYGQGTDWALLLPGVDPGLADVQELIDAAFWLQLQAAYDYAGGTVVVGLEMEP